MSIEKMLVDAVTEAVVANIKPYIVDEHKLLTEAEVMKLLGVETSGTMRRMRQEGLPGYQPMGKHWFYFLDEVKDFVVRNGRAV